ncbi:GAF domain-containing protein [Klenkia soli]|uniref:GAF domain-containing protein n=1 Tax=Klenkia soli TaxID=1052260 RepID=A0A1H0EZX4_9ACTN|nr:GAF and ANTAR domain-containing protein [Klenkia soli]SDN87836.1 GAF domain-containing protein [Klenkia soli]
MRSDDQAADGDRRSPRAADALAGLLVADESMRSVLLRVAEVAVQTLADSSEASVTLVERGRPTSASWTGLLAFELDEAQFGLDHGPGLEAAVSGRALVVGDMRTEKRWPGFADLAVRQGALSSLSTPIPIQHGLRAALNLYSPEPDAYGEQQQALVRDLAGVAAVAIGNMHSYDQVQRTAAKLQEAMASRATIEQAKGILMARHRIDAEEAFQVLSARSQHANRKVRDLAADIVAEFDGGGPPVTG